jgi:hypothetical protein
MQAVSIRIGPLAFDHVDYDAEGDILYLHVGQPQPGEGETPAGHSFASPRAPSKLLA